ncbi:Sodium-dependent glucose transporter 1 [Pseudolycoriella hygida]|uniref:Sodium-dependent glucose transporter 1 n=1 Tax=Pseudolycoriella hygida TaxID=35572 RepID=A0A9Q0MYA1_9DIPT|nr:Sodium-dependent glucose transporter 1 [Pseudolycoriella hygida]
MGDESVEQGQPKPHSKKLKVLTTAAVYFGNIGLGYYVNAIPPALEDIRLQYGAEIDEISVVFTIELILYCVGAITYGIVTKYINRQTVSIGALAGMAFSLYMIPHIPNIKVFFVIGGVVGVASGLYDALQIVWIVEIWQEKCAPFILAQHLFFAIGTNIPSILIAPFLSTDKTTTSRIYIPFTILGAITTLALLFQILLFTFCRYHTPPIYANDVSDKLTSTNASQAQNEQASHDTSIVGTDSSSIMGMNKTKLQLIIISGMFLGAYMGMEVCTLQFVPIFGQYSELHMTESAAAYVLSGLTGMFALGRAIGLVLIFKMQPEAILCINCFLVVVGNLILLLWASYNLTMFWVGCVILGAGFSTMYPAFCAFMEKYLVITNSIGSFFCVVGSVFASIYPLIVGHLIKQRAVVLTYTNFFSTVACILSIVWGYIIVRTVKTRV